MKKIYYVVIVAFLILAGVVLAGTIVPGHQKKINSGRTDADTNGYPDAGVTVNGAYTSLYAYDTNGDWYWDLGDGRIQGTVESADELDQETLTECDYQVQYRGNFENDPFLNSGWIINTINCSGFDDDNQYNYLIVHKSDPRYKGNHDWAIWDEWEYQVLTISGYGNLVRPETPVGQE